MAKDMGSSRTDTIVKVMLVFFISLLSFSVGTFVGKQVSDSDHRRIALESEMKDSREVASQDNEQGGSKVTEKDVDNLAEEFVNKEKQDAATDTQAAAPTAPAAADETTDAPKAETKEGADGYKSYTHNAKEDKSAEKGKDMAENKADAAAEKVANNEALSDGQAESRKPSSTLPGVATSSVGKFTVQVASYATEDEAKGQATNLKNKGWNAFYIPASVGGRTWYRVSVGLFNNQKSAQAFMRDFVKESGNKTPIVSKIVQ